MADKNQDGTPGTSTSTGGATATGNSGASTGGAVTITLSGSSSTSTSTTTGAGAGKGSGKGGDKETGDERPHVYNITVDARGISGNVGDGKSSGDAGTPSHINSESDKGHAALHRIATGAK